MGSVSFLLLFLLSVISFPIEGTERALSYDWKPGGESFVPHSGTIPSCPPSPLVLPNNTEHPVCSPFDCKQLGSLCFPFPNESHPECGLITVRGCTGEDRPKIRLDDGGRTFWVKNISDGDSIIVNYWWHRPGGYKCEFIENLTSSISLKLAPTLTELTLFKCHRSLNISLTADYAYKDCDDDYIIHYNRPNNSAPIPPLPPPPKCSIIHYPVNKSSDMADLHALLTSDVTLQLHITRDSSIIQYVTVAAVNAADREGTECWLSIIVETLVGLEYTIEGCH